ncbi:MAG TPA: reverse transcriptase domain-containing protein [Pirellulales bacterium]
MGKLLLAISHPDRLYRAWQTVQAQVRRTVWPQLAAERDQIDRAPLRALRTIQRQLRAGTYRFSPKLGYAKARSGGSRRGIAVPCVRDRIVQRCILNALYSSDPELKACLGGLPSLLQVPTSFAGTPGRGVPEAVALVYRTIRNGARAVAYSDVKEFFPHVPRAEVIELLRSHITDTAFLNLFESSLETEIVNYSDIEEWASLFPLNDVGVPQGSLLSVVVANLSLRHFDQRLNQHGLTTVRYLDDFAILAPDVSAAYAGFQAAQAELARLGMTCYAPGDGSQKAFLGPVEAGFDFLGCRVHPDGVAPARKAQRKLLAEVVALLKSGKSQVRGFQSNSTRRRMQEAYAQTLVQIDRKVRGWGDAYRFVSNRVVFSQLDTKISRAIDRFEGWYRRRLIEAGPPERRRMQGVALLADTSPNKVLQSSRDLSPKEDLLARSETTATDAEIR